MLQPHCAGPGIEDSCVAVGDGGQVVAERGSVDAAAGNEAEEVPGTLVDAEADDRARQHRQHLL